MIVQWRRGGQRVSLLGIRLQVGIILTMFCLPGPCRAGEGSAQPIPDLTKGEELTRRNEFLVGPAGFTCDIWRARQGSNEHEFIRQCRVIEVEEGSPADGLLRKGDVILGADGNGAGRVVPFSSHPHQAIGDAVTAAEACDPATLNFLVWREGKTGVVGLTLETLGAYSDTAPYHCPKSRRILRKCIGEFYEANEPGEVGLGMLLLLAADDPDDPNSAKYQDRAREWAYQLKADTVGEVKGGPWQISYKMVALSEYFLKTGDKGILPTIENHALRFARGQSWFGTTGHRFAEVLEDGSTNGPIAGYGPINASGLAGFWGLVMAREAGVNHPEVEVAIRRADTFFSSYAFRSVMPYGEHEFTIDAVNYDINAKHTTCAFINSLLPHRQEEARWYTMLSVASPPERYYAHCGPYLAQVFNPLGAAIGGEAAAHHHFKQVRWHMDLDRRWDGVINYSGRTGYRGFPVAATQLFTYALPLRQLYLTGRGHPKSLQISQAGLSAIIESENFNPADESNGRLIESLSSWAPPERTRAAVELGVKARDGAQRAGILKTLHALAVSDSTRPLERAGACHALFRIKDVSSVPVLVECLKDADAYVRFVASKGLQEFPRESVMPHIDTILELAATTRQPTFPMVEGDPLQFAHGELAALLFDKRKGLLRESIEGVDRAKLWPAVRELSQTSAGMKRSALATLYPKLSREEMLEIGGVVIDSARLRAPADSMFANDIQMAALDLLQKHSVEDALYLIQELYGDDRQLPYFSRYGASLLDFDDSLEVMQRVAEMQLVRAMDISEFTAAMERSTDDGTFLKLKAIKSASAGDNTLRLPARQTTLSVEAVNHARQNPEDTIYTWRKVYGAGGVSFSPNATWQSGNTTVTFTDAKPGNYRFEVTMSDTLGFNVVTGTVDVTLFDKAGRLPLNRPPATRDLSARALPGEACRLTLPGEDPDGDDLGFVVTRQPMHGKLTGSGADRLYTPRLGFQGTDTFTFSVIDGQGATATGKATLHVSGENLGVAVYEGFDYPDGSIQGREGGSSFGFGGPWKIHKDTDDHYLVSSGSWSPAGFPVTGGKLGNGQHWWSCTRPLDPAVVSAQGLLADGGELWFSVICGNPETSENRLWFGLREDSDKDAAELGFRLERGSLMAWKDGKEAGTTRVGWGSGRAEQKFPKDTPHMIILRCDWGETDEAPDTLEIYRMFNAQGHGPIILEEPVSVMSEPVDQSRLDSIFMKDTGGFLDEIRVGHDLRSVLMGTTPLR